MRSPFYFIVEPLDGKTYDNTRRFGDVDFVISSSQEDHTVTQRHAVVVATPSGYTGPIMDGDIVIVHHNVFRRYYDMKGREKDSFSFLRPGTYFVDDMQLYAYKQGGAWYSVGKYNFVRPVEKIHEGFQFDTDKYVQQVGEVVMGSEYMKSIGISKGSRIGFKEDSEYEFRIDDEILYRVADNRIVINYDI